MERTRENVFLTTFLVILSFFLAINESAAQSPLEKQKEALDMIAKFAERICEDIPLEGSGKNLELTGKAKAELNKIIKAMVDLGVEGAAKYQNTEYSGLL